jgi:predicted DNA-binding transcriptional regulator AlpA
METRFLRKAQVAGRYGINVRSLERWLKDGRLPSPMYRGRIPLWRESDLDAADRAAMAAPARPKRENAAGKTEAAA